LNVNDEFRLCQALSQLVVLLLELADLFKERIVFRLGPSAMGGQSLVTLLAPVSEM